MEFSTRRIVLRRVGGFIVAAVLSPVARLAAQGENSTRADHPFSPLMAKLSTYMSEARSRPPARGKWWKKRSITFSIPSLPWFPAPNCLADMRQSNLSALMVARKFQRLLPQKILCGPIEAAFANAEFGHSDETDDYTHVGGAHPGSSIVPAALALGENFGIGGMHFLRAVVLRLRYRNSGYGYVGWRALGA